MTKKHFDRNGVRIGLEENNVVVIHNKTHEATLKEFNIQPGQIGVVVGWGCVMVELRKDVTWKKLLSCGPSSYMYGTFNDTDLEVIGTL